jgi:hypothetical protein
MYLFFMAIYPSKIRQEVSWDWTYSFLVTGRRKPSGTRQGPSMIITLWQTLIRFPNVSLTFRLHTCWDSRARGGTVGWGTALQAGRSQVWFPMVSLDFVIDIILRPPYSLGADSASNRNEYQKFFLGGRGGRCVRLTPLLHSCADCLEIWEPEPPGTLRVCPGL